MARDKLTEYSATASDNTVCGDVNIAENSALPSDLNNFAREIMSHLKNFSDGTDAITGLTVDGDIKLDGNYPTGTNNVALGDTALDDGSLSGSNNTAIGHATLTANTSGSFNVAVGTDALLSNTTGENNIAVGRGLYTNTTGSNNTAVGRSALYSSTTSSNNTALGYSALFANTTGTQNVAVGANALDANTTGSYSVAIGYGALGAATSPNSNTAVGLNALQSVTTGHSNTAIGGSFSGYAGGSITTATFNTMLGTDAGRSVTTGGSNTFLGTGSGGLVTTGQKNTILGMYNGNQGGLDIRTSSNNIVLSDGDGNPRFQIDGSGNPKIGPATTTFRTTPGAGVNGADIRADDSGGGRIRLSRSGTDGATMISFINTNGEVGGIDTSGTSTAYNTSSDYRLKENVVGMTGATERLKQLNPVRFNFIADADTTVDGFLAHEVQIVVPEAIRGTHNEVDDDGNPVYQGIDQSKLVPLLVATIQELEARIATLEGAN